MKANKGFWSTVSVAVLWFASVGAAASGNTAVAVKAVTVTHGSVHDWAFTEGWPRAFVVNISILSGVAK